MIKVLNQCAVIIKFITVIVIAASITVVSQDYSFDIPKKEEARILFNGNLDVKWAFLRTRNHSPFYQMQFSQYKNVEHNLSQYRLDYYFNGEYRNQKLLFQMKTFSQYSKEAPLQISMYELYGSLNLSPRLSFGIGKKRFIWGKGYAFNPVGYINTEKDPENPELALAGKPLAFLTYNRSFDSDILQNFSFSGVLLPPEPEYNDKFAPLNKTDIAFKMYFLIKDIDIDIMALYGKNNLSKYGFDFSTNLKNNIEAHGELSVNFNESRYSIYNGGLRHEFIDGSSYLIGLRYLNKYNTTFILEYYFDHRGLSQHQYEDYLHYLDANLSTDDQIIIDELKRTINMGFPSKTLMKEYLYFSIKQPEPFSLVYSAINIFTIYNLIDNSYIISPRITYSPYTNYEVILWPTLSSGGESSEFGNKMAEKKIEIWLRYFF